MPHKRAKRSVREKTRAESGADLVPGVRKSIENEEIPKGAARVLNAAKIQQDFAEKKRKQRDEADGAGPSRKKQKGGAGGQNEGANALRIQPGESIGHFNRRVEDSLRHTVKEAMQSSSAKMRRTRKEEEEELAQKKAERKAANASSKAARSTKTSSGSDDDEEPPSKPKPEDKSERAVPLRRPETKHDGKAKEFERVSSSAPKRLNDIVQAPPQIKQLPRKAKKLAAAGGAPKSGISLKDGVLSMAQKAMMEEERDRVIRLYREMKRRKGST